MNVKNSFLLFLICLSQVSFGQNLLKTRSLSIFKDGSSFVQKSGKINTTNGKYVLSNDQLPSALNGTFWVSSPSNRIASVVSFVDTATIQRLDEAQTQGDLLLANKGKTVKIFLSETVQYTGEIVAISTTDHGFGTPKTPVLLQLKDDKGKYQIINVSQILRVEFDTAPLFASKQTIKKLRSNLSIRFNDTKSEESLNMHYLQHGISWSPFYKLVLLENKKAKLSLRAEMMNDLEDYEDIDLNFVVGTPNFKYANSIAGLLNFSNLIHTQNMVFKNTSEDVFGLSAYGGAVQREVMREKSPFNNNLIGDNIQDFYFYRLKNFSLAKGERTHVNIFETEIAVDHIYESSFTENPYFDLMARANFRTDDNAVIYHSLKLNNNTKNPFVAAPVTVLSEKGNESFPIAQDLLGFTPMNSDSYVKLSEMKDIKITQTETVTKREATDIRWSGDLMWQKISVEVKMTVVNYKNEPVKMCVNRKITGVTDKTEGTWRIAKSVVENNNYSYLNQSNHVIWDFDVAAGETKTITYSYTNYCHY